MKLIIEIPDEDYRFIQDLQSLIIGGRGNCKTIQHNVINAIKNGISYNPTGDLISREALKEAIKNVYNETRDGIVKFGIEKAYKEIDNAPTVEPKRPQGDCENCDFRKFSETFIDGVVDLMNKNGITSVEQLSELLKGGAGNGQLD